MANKLPDKAKQKKSNPGRNLLLTLTLVPLIIGLLLILAWLLDISVFDTPELNVTVGILFFLFGFAASNAIQKRWILATGWGLLMCADIIILAWLDVWAQTVALVVGVAGLGFLGWEFYRQYQRNR